MDVFVNKADQFCQGVIGFRISNSHDDKQQLKSTEPHGATLSRQHYGTAAKGSSGSATKDTRVASSWDGSGNAGEHESPAALPGWFQKSRRLGAR